MISAINETKYQEAIENFMIPVSLEQRQKQLDESLSRCGYANEVEFNRVKKYHKYGDYRYEENHSQKLPDFQSRKDAAIFFYQLVEYWLPRDVHFGSVSYSGKCLSFVVEICDDGYAHTCTDILTRIFRLRRSELFKLSFAHSACYHRFEYQKRITEESLWEFIHQEEGGDK